MSEKMKRFLTAQVTRLATMLCVGTLSISFAFAQDNSLKAPEVLDLDDPFARGINRAADQASDGLSLPKPNGQTTGAAKLGKDLLGEQNTRALKVNLYRVAALAVSQGSAVGQIFEESNQDVERGSRPQIPYLRIGTFNDAAAARQTAINLKSLMGDYIGGHFILRDKSSAVELDIGPLHTVSHAENYCEILLKQSNGLVTDCFAVLEYPGYEPLDTFQSTAMLRLSTEAVKSILSAGDSGVFDLQGSSAQLLRVKEGDMLGNGVDQIVKIVPNAVILVADDGVITSLPLDYIPESQFDTAPLETEQTEQTLPQNN
ncbi:MAG: hypothetical protein ACON4G_00380 [Candidatus Puniceispirillaceae bacterium]